jgi:hypothetical protein
LAGFFAVFFIALPRMKRRHTTARAVSSGCAFVVKDFDRRNTRRDGSESCPRRMSRQRGLRIARLQRSSYSPRLHGAGSPSPGAIDFAAA